MIAGAYWAMEGLYGAGKTTLLETLHRQLLERGASVAMVEWNSTSIARAAVPFKESGALSPEALLLVELADFAIVLKTQIMPAIDAGKIVLGDRSVYSAIARATVRGADRRWADNVTSFARDPSGIFYLDVPIETCVARRITQGRPWHGIMSGEDFLSPQLGPAERFTLYQQMLDAKYREIMPTGVVRFVDPGAPDVVPRLVASILDDRSTRNS